MSLSLSLKLNKEKNWPPIYFTAFSMAAQPSCFQIIEKDFHKWFDQMWVSVRTFSCIQN